MKIADSDTVIGVSEVWVDLDLREDIITIPVLVTATDGETIETYNIILERMSNSTELELTWDDDVLTADEDGNYEITLTTLVESGILKATADSKIGIDLNATGTIEYGQKQVTINIDYSQDEMVIPIYAIAEDETERNSTLTIKYGTRISGKITTENIDGKHKSLVTVYRTDDDREEGAQKPSGCRA